MSNKWDDLRYVISLDIELQNVNLKENKNQRNMEVENERYVYELVDILCWRRVRLQKQFDQVV